MTDHCPDHDRLVSDAASATTLVERVERDGAETRAALRDLRVEMPDVVRAAVAPLEKRIVGLDDRVRTLENGRLSDSAIREHASQRTLSVRGWVALVIGAMGAASGIGAFVSRLMGGG